MAPIVLLALVTLAAGAQGKQCYDCGYTVNGWKDGGENVQEQLPDIALCGDQAQLEDHVADCGEGEECCGVVKEYFVMAAHAGLPERIDLVARHACEKTLVNLFPDYPAIVCDSEAYGCRNISYEEIPIHTATFAEICFCEGNKCNKDVPNLPDPDPSTMRPTDPLPGKYHTCYDCGYRCNNMVGNSCRPEPIDTEGKIPFCGNDAGSMSAKTKKCGGEEECCGSLKEYYTKTHEDGGKTTDMVAYHGCEKDINSALHTETVVVCSGHTNNCYNVSQDDITNDLITNAVGCFCDTDLCNNHVPDFDDPETDTTTSEPECPDCRKCFSCGYIKNGDGEPVEIPDVPFCGDFAVGTDNTATCGKEDCCASLKEYIITLDEETGESSTQTIGRHGCSKDLDHLGEYSVTCKDHGKTDCFQVDDAKLPDHGDNTTIVKAEICLCDTDMCNNDDYIPDIKTTTTKKTTIITTTKKTTIITTTAAVPGAASRIVAAQILSLLSVLTLIF